MVYLVTQMGGKSLKSCRDAFPQDNVIPLRDLMLDLTARSVLAGHSKVILRKLFVAVRIKSYQTAGQD